MKIKLINSIIEIHFLHEEEYLKFFSSYLVERGEVDLFIYQDAYVEEEDKGEKKIESKYYDLFFKDNQEIQYNKDEGSSLYKGKIVYGDNVMRFASVDEHDFFMIILLVQYIVTRFLQSKYECILMHGSSINYRDKGIIFTAPSGTGKSTHSRLWKQYYDIVYINDDKNYIVKEDDKLYLYGNPWSGKHHLDNNIIVQLTNIVFLYQSKENVVRKLDKREAFLKLMTQVVTPLSEKDFDKWNNMIDSLLDLPCYLLGCRIDKEAVDLIKDTIEGE